MNPVDFLSDSLSTAFANIKSRALDILFLVVGFLVAAFFATGLLVTPDANHAMGGAIALVAIVLLGALVRRLRRRLD